MSNNETQPAEAQDDTSPAPKKPSFLAAIRSALPVGQAKLDISEFADGETVWAVNRTAGYLFCTVNHAGGKREFTIPKTGPHPVPISGGNVDSNIPQVPLEALKASTELQHYLNGSMPARVGLRQPPLQLMSEEQAMEYYMGMAGGSSIEDAARAFNEVLDSTLRASARRAAGKGGQFKSGLVMRDGDGTRPPIYTTGATADALDENRREAGRAPRSVDYMEIEDDQLDFDLPETKSVQQRVIDLCAAAKAGTITPKEFGSTLRNYASDGVRLSYEDAEYAFLYGPEQCSKFCAKLANSIDPTKPMLYQEGLSGAGEGGVYGTGLRE